MNACQAYKHFHEDARKHKKGEWHIESITKDKHFNDSLEMKKGMNKRKAGLWNCWDI